MMAINEGIMHIGRACEESGEDDKYCTFAKENFNFVVLENAMKWGSLEPQVSSELYLGKVSKIKCVLFVENSTKAEPPPSPPCL